MWKLHQLGSSPETDPTEKWLYTIQCSATYTVCFPWHKAAVTCLLCLYCKAVNQRNTTARLTHLTPIGVLHMRVYAKTHMFFLGLSWIRARFLPAHSRAQNTMNRNVEHIEDDTKQPFIGLWFPYLKGPNISGLVCFEAEKAALHRCSIQILPIAFLRLERKLN